LIDREEFRCPELQRLVIDGRNCYEACRSDPQWTEKITSVFKLAISHFHPNPGESFSVRDLLLPLATISSIESLSITDLDLHPSPDPVTPNLNLSSVNILDLEDLHGFEVAGQIIRFLNNPLKMSIIRCTFQDITDQSTHFASIGEEGELYLEKIDHDLAPLLRLWHGYVLNITDCPRFDDTLLDAMGSKENGVFNCTAYMDHLHIHNCPNFSIAALRRFVESRLDLPVDNDNPWNQVTPRVRSVHLSGNVPSMSQAEKAWFDTNA
jgi:hypothetical protein